MPSFTASSRLVVSEALDDWEIEDDEREAVINALSWGGINDSALLVEVMEDGYVSRREIQLIDTDKLEDDGITLSQRRSWQSRIWMPSLPAGRIQLAYDIVMNEDIPTFQITASMENYKPSRPILSVILNGVARTDSSLIIDGLNTELTRDIMIDMVIVASMMFEDRGSLSVW